MAATIGGGEWHQVRRRVFRDWVPHWDSFKSSEAVQEGMKVTSFFISDFPEKCKEEDLGGLFGCIGDLVEVVIAPRRNSGGKRFGFSRFVEVEDARLLAVKLDNVIIEGNKIHANIPRYERKMLVAGLSSMSKDKVSVSRARERNQWYGGCRFDERSRGLILEDRFPMLWLTGQEGGRSGWRRRNLNR